MKSKLFFILILLLLLSILPACTQNNGSSLQPEENPDISGDITPDEENEDPDQEKPDNTDQTPNPDAGLSLTQNEFSLTVGQTVLLELHYTPLYETDNATPTFSVSDPTVVSVGENGSVTALASGSATITVSCGTFQTKCSITVAKIPNNTPGITLETSSIQLIKGKQTSIRAVFVPSYQGDSTAISYASDQPSIASVDQNGKITAIAAGTAHITLSAENGKFTQTLTVKVPHSFSLLAAGDNLLHSGIYNDAKDRTGGTGYDFLSIYQAIANKVGGADFALINQETVFTGSTPSSYPVLNCPQEAVKALADLGFDVISLANNHCLDKGTDGLRSSMAYLDTLKDVIRLGAYYKANNDALKIRVIEKDGIKVALLAYTTFTNKFPDDFNSSGLYVPWVAEDAILGDLARAKQQADAVLVFMHWGDENTFAVTSEQKNLAQFLADNGADVIIGAHPHVIQGVEVLQSADGRSVPCAYSLGTLVSNMQNEENMLSCLLTLDFVKDPDTGKIRVENLQMDPYVFYYDMSYKNSALYRLTDLTEELAASHGIGNYPKESSVKNTLSIQRLYGYLHQYINAQYLPDDIKK